MEIQNDPRFFTGNVIDKRLAALKNLTIVSGLMLGTALSQCFSLDKKYHFTKGGMCSLVSVFQILSFVVLMRVVFVCFMSLYTMCQQLYHIYRLMTSGPTGVELAGEYYLNRNIVVWRHTAVNRLLKSFYLFLAALGLILFVKIMKDGDTIKECYASGGGSKDVDYTELAKFVIAITRNATLAQPGVPLQIQTPAPPPKQPEDNLSKNIQFGLAWVVLACFWACAYVLYHIHTTHENVFNHVYAKCRELLPSTRVWNTQSLSSPA